MILSDDNEFVHSILGFETKARIKIKTILAKKLRLIFSKKMLIFLTWQKVICFFLLKKSLNCLIFWDENKNFILSISCFQSSTGMSFYQFCVSRQEQEILNCFSRLSKKKLGQFSKDFFKTRIPVGIWLYMLEYQ